MRMVNLIRKKREGLSHTPAELEYIISAYTKDEIPDYQMAAWLMATFLQGMNREETAALTIAMARSGEMVDLSSIAGIKIDKHSTGGVADTTTLIVAPLVAAAGVPVAKMSGRGLGFTGGTIDKLESIPGFRTQLDKNEFLDAVKKHSLAITGQGPAIAPADGKIYALRDVTSTVESIPLIASSIMSKKIAAGADKILLDVKVGSGAFMKNLPVAIELARTMVDIGILVGRETKAVLTSMEEPLGLAVGNSLEVKEAIDVLTGHGPEELRRVSLLLGAHMLVLAGEAPNIIVANKLLLELIENQKALDKFQEFIVSQGGNPKLITKKELLPEAAFKIDVKSEQEGYIQHIDTAQIGYSAMVLGAGREYKGQRIDLAAGIIMRCRIGDFIRAGQPLAVIHTNDLVKGQESRQRILKAITCSSIHCEKPKLILGTVDNDGFKEYVS
ncbi:MAG: thymidine phosphorylase [Veillonellales bacterium]